MKLFYRMLVTLILVMLVVSVASTQEPVGRIYAKVTLRDGDTLEGRVSWGEHETIWSHTFDASYKFYDHNRDAYQRRRELYGKRPSSLTSQFAVFFGDISRIERHGSRALVLLKDEREFEVYSGDVGESLYMSDVDLGKVKVKWNEIETIVFLNEPKEFSEYSVENAYPIYGKINTRSDHVFKGFILWDNDESLSTDIIDAKDGRYDRNIPFSKIKSIMPRSSRSSEVVLVTGKEMILSGTNDVDKGNRGLIVADPDYGIISIEWRDVDLVEFEHNVPSQKYSDFKNGKPLRGVLTDDRGNEYEGYIRWDDDEAMTTDFLNGESYGYDMKLSFNKIKEIRRRTRKSAVAVMKNGVEFRLSGSNDVNSGNKGIVILKNLNDREGNLFEWDEFESVVFK